MRTRPGTCRGGFTPQQACGATNFMSRTISPDAAAPMPYAVQISNETRFGQGAG